MKVKNKVISIMLAVFMVFAMMPMFAQHAYAAEEQINLFGGVITLGENLSVDETLVQNIKDVYISFTQDDLYPKEIFTQRAPKLWTWKVPDDLDMIGESATIYIKTSTTSYYEPVRIKINIKDLDFSEAITGKTYTGKKIGVGKFEIDLGTPYFTQNDFTYSYSNNLNVGKASVKITAKKDSDVYGSKTVKFDIRPKGVTIKAPKKGKKAFTARWTRQKTKMSKSRITGYQIQYSTDKTFSTYKTKNVKGYKKTSKKITGLSKKTTYYVRVRTYMKVGSACYYSTWSKTKSVKTK